MRQSDYLEGKVPDPPSSSDAALYKELSTYDVNELLQISQTHSSEKMRKMASAVIFDRRTFRPVVRPTASSQIPNVSGVSIMASDGADFGSGFSNSVSNSNYAIVSGSVYTVSGDLAYHRPLSEEERITREHYQMQLARARADEQRRRDNAQASYYNYAGAALGGGGSSATSTATGFNIQIPEQVKTRPIIKERKPSRLKPLKDKITKDLATIKSAIKRDVTDPFLNWLKK